VLSLSDCPLQASNLHSDFVSLSFALKRSASLRFALLRTAHSGLPAW